MFSGRQYPSMVSGSGYLVDYDSARCIFGEVMKLPYFHLEVSSGDGGRDILFTTVRGGNLSKMFCQHFLAVPQLPCCPITERVTLRTTFTKPF